MSWRHVLRHAIAALRSYLTPHRMCADCGEPLQRSYDRGGTYSWECMICCTHIAPLYRDWWRQRQKELSA